MLGWSGRQEHDSRAQHRWRGSCLALYSYPYSPLPLLLSQSSYFWPLGMVALGVLGRSLAGIAVFEVKV
jgi:hypothetical protein